MRQSGVCSSPAALVVFWSVAWGLQGEICPDSSPRRELHSTSAADKAAYGVSVGVLKQTMKPDFMAHSGGNQSSLAGCNKWRRILFSNPAWILSRSIQRWMILRSPNLPAKDAP